MMAEKLLEIVTFLRGRGVSEETINCIEEQKIDREVILQMEDVQLAKYLPSYGDRIALFNFCKHQTYSMKRKQGLFEKLREKLQLRKENQTREEEPETSNKTKKAKAKTSTRNIEIGWVHTDGKITKQIRAKQGGGTRKISVNIQSGYHEILKQGKSLFFPDGESSKGHESDFEFDVWDFKQNPFPKDVSIDMIYDTVKLPLLRFYVSTQPKSVLSEESDYHNLSNADCVSEPDNEQSVDQNYQQDSKDEPHDFLPEVFIVSEEVLTDSSVTRETPASSSQETVALVISDPMAFSVDKNYAILQDDSDPEIIFGAQQTVNDDFSDLSDTLIYEPDELPENPLNILPETILVLHHSNSFIEMIDAFSDPEILNKTLKVRRLLPDNSVEKGSGSGVIRDVYSSFWAEFYERCTLGTTLKVPFLRHDFCAATWKAIGRILLKGFQDCKYLPIKLAPPFLEEMLYGAVHSDLKTSFLQFVSSQEQDVLKTALDDFSSVDDDDLLEVLDRYECRKRVTAANLPEILKEISHKELVQKPMFVIDCWREITQPQIHLNSGELTKMYSDLKPTPKKVAGILNFPTGMTSKQAEVAQHLKRYVRELTEEKLGRFLRFCTGSDLLVSMVIKVEFTIQTSFTRRPIAHTCGMVLELLDSYDHFPDFRTSWVTWKRAVRGKSDLITGLQKPVGHVTDALVKLQS
ncbi:uncharacterized protein LOC133442491 [Cololabis saira]|uniref:uncharacterized protein LOC133442491 n=1 Tax=Cololabis saira TaxID=129043 RepID=UPI002AD2F204|nr:uncharacterized protein LOC133442491 [Cololabis saira]